jgi:hypothetical protein
MDPEINQRLDQIEKLVADNNAMLVKMRKAQKNAAYVRAFYWVVIIGLTLASFYYIEPYLTQLGAAYGIGPGATATSTTTNPDGSTTTSPTDTASVLSLLKQYEASQKAKTTQ